jgi:hypothetical protein
MPISERETAKPAKYFHAAFGNPFSQALLLLRDYRIRATDAAIDYPTKSGEAQCESRNGAG